MSYVAEKILQPKDTVVKQFALHPIRLVFDWIWGVLGCWLLLIPTVKAIIATVAYKTTEYVLTESRLIEKYGLFNVHCDEMALDKIENITLEQGFWGRVFKYGTVVVQGTNRNHIYLKDIRNPEEVRKAIYSINTN